MEYISKNRKIEFTTILEDKQKATVFRHFKGTTHKIITIAKNSETLEKLVIYTHDDDNMVWARPIDMFFERVDEEKYPEIKQEYRFEKID